MARRSSWVSMADQTSTRCIPESITRKFSSTPSTCSPATATTCGSFRSRCARPISAQRGSWPVAPRASSSRPFEQGEIGPDLFRAACEFGLGFGFEAPRSTLSRRPVAILGQDQEPHTSRDGSGRWVDWVKINEPHTVCYASGQCRIFKCTICSRKTSLAQNAMSLSALLEQIEEPWTRLDKAGPSGPSTARVERVFNPDRKDHHWRRPKLINQGSVITLA